MVLDMYLQLCGVAFEFIEIQVKEHMVKKC